MAPCLGDCVIMTFAQNMKCGCRRAQASKAGLSSVLSAGGHPDEGQIACTRGCGTLVIPSHYEYGYSAQTGRICFLLFCWLSFLAASFPANSFLFFTICCHDVHQSPSSSSACLHDLLLSIIADIYHLFLSISEPLEKKPDTKTEVFVMY